LVKYSATAVIPWEKLSKKTKALLRSIKEEEFEPYELIDKICSKLGAEAVLSIHESDSVVEVQNAKNDYRDILDDMMNMANTMPFGFKIKIKASSPVTYASAEKKENNNLSMRRDIKQQEDLCVNSEEEMVDEGLSIDYLLSDEIIDDFDEIETNKNDLLGRSLDEGIFN
jgi:hypothetical protein